MWEGRKGKGVLNRWEQTAPPGPWEWRGAGQGWGQTDPRTWTSSCAGRVRRGPRR